MKKFLLSIIATGLIGTYAMADEPNTMVIHYNDGTTQNIQIDKINYLDFITTSQPGTGEQPPVSDPTPNMFSFTSVSSTPTLVAQMNWQDVNNKIYGSEGLTADNFWDNYKHEYNVTISVNNLKSSTNHYPAGEYKIVSSGVQVGTQYAYDQDGIFCNVLFTNTSTQTSQIDFSVNNLCKTDLTWGNTDGKGARYTVTITLTPNNNYAHREITITQVFYVLNDFQPYTYNPVYTIENSNPATITTLGRVIPGYGWAMQLDIAQAFQVEKGKNIFDYFADSQVNITYGNVKPTPEISFGFLNTSHPGVEYGMPPFQEHIVGLTSALNTTQKDVPMTYTVELVNGETLTNNFIVRFINPFISGTPSALTIMANHVGTQTVYGEKSVVVVEAINPTSNIYSYYNGALALSDKATQDYQMRASQVSVAYGWNEKKGDYADFATQILNNPNNSLTLDAQTGVIEYVSSGIVANRDYTLYLNAVVTFEDLSVVTVEIPVKFVRNN